MLSIAHDQACFEMRAECREHGPHALERQRGVGVHVDAMRRGGAVQRVRELSRQLEDRVAALGSWRSGELRFFSDTVLDESLHVTRTREPTRSVLTRIVREEYPPGDIAALLRPFTKETLTPGAKYAALTRLLGLTPSETSVLALAEHGGTVRDIVTHATQNGTAMADALRAVFIALCSSALLAEGWAKAGAA